MEHVILYYISNWQHIAYLILFLAMIIEGDVFLFTAAFFTQQGVLNPIFVFLSVFAGISFGDFLWYRAGVWINHSSSFVMRCVEKISGPFDKHLLQRPQRTIFISKFLYGIHHALMLRAGTLKLEQKKFLKDDFVANIFWIIIVGGLGYISGASYSAIKHYLKFAEGTLLAGIIIFLLIEIIITHISKNKI